MRRWIACFVLAVTMTARPAPGVVLHNDADAPTVRPADGVVGKWSGNASAVAIGKGGWTTTNYILSTTHQGGGVNSSVYFAGRGYKVVASYSAGIDLRVCRIETSDGYNADLTDFALCYPSGDETGRPIVLGGYGMGRGSNLKTSTGVVYGYSWANSGIARWGSNTIDSAIGDYVSADFDDPSTHDASVGLYDSGGGWFIQSGDTWYVAGLSRTVERLNESWFLNGATGLPDPDLVGGARVSPYATWVESKMHPIPAGDANRDGLVDSQDFTVLKSHFGLGGNWANGDFNADGGVDIQDFTILKANYGTGTAGAADDTEVPEPAGLLLWSAGGWVFVLRRGTERSVFAEPG